MVNGRPRLKGKVLKEAPEKHVNHQMQIRETVEVSVGAPEARGDNTQS